MNRPDLETDVVVVGGGGAGLTAAATAAILAPNLDVVVLERDAGEPCNSEIASNFIPAAGTRYQRAAGVEDSPEIFAADVLRKNAGGSDRALTLELCRRSAEAVHWLVDGLGVDLEFAPELTWLGHSRRRIHAHPQRGGPPVMARLRACCAERANVRVFDRTPATGLVVGADGEVVGVGAERDGAPLRVAARRVILATGGFNANRAMLAEHVPEMADAPNIGSACDTGDGIRWGAAAGGALAHMSGYQGRDCIFPDGTRVTPPVLNEGGIAVNATGERFVDERGDYSALARVYRAQPGGFAVFVWDARIQAMVENVLVMRRAMARGGIVRGESAEAIADAFDLPAAALAATIERYNRGVRRGADAFGRGGLTRPLEPPLYAARITGAIAHTQGGLVVDMACRVLRADATPVANLYAAGNTMAGLSGDGPAGYLTGNGLLVAYTSGLVVGRDVAAALRGR